MTGRYVEHNGIADAKRKEAYIRHKNMLIGKALQIRLAEEKSNRMEHQRKDLIRVVKEGSINE